MWFVFPDSNTNANQWLTPDGWYMCFTSKCCLQIIVQKKKEFTKRWKNRWLTNRDNDNVRQCHALPVLKSLHPYNRCAAFLATPWQLLSLSLRFVTCLHTTCSPMCYPGVPRRWITKHFAPYRILEPQGWIWRYKDAPLLLSSTHSWTLPAYHQFLPTPFLFTVCLFVACKCCMIIKKKKKNTFWSIAFYFSIFLKA